MDGVESANEQGSKRENKVKHGGGGYNHNASCLRHYLTNTITLQDRQEVIIGNHLQVQVAVRVARL